MTVETPSLFVTGIRDPDQIEGYSLVRVPDDMDVLKISYTRPHGTFLPRRRSFEFKRTGKPIAEPDHTSSADIRMETAPLPSSAIVERDHLPAGRKSPEVSKQELQREIAATSKEFDARLDQLFKSIDSMG